MERIDSQEMSIICCSLRLFFLSIVSYIITASHSAMIFSFRVGRQLIRRPSSRIQFAYLEKKPAQFIHGPKRRPSSIRCLISVETIATAAIQAARTQGRRSSGSDVPDVKI
jgi:hypothetical protein